MGHFLSAFTSTEYKPLITTERFNHIHGGRSEVNKIQSHIPILKNVLHLFTIKILDVYQDVVTLRCAFDKLRLQPRGQKE